jgi:hypothetical protein
VRHGEPERFGRLEIDRQIGLGWRLHRQVGRPLALENTIDVNSSAPVLVDRIRPIRDEPAGTDEVAIGVHRGQLVLCRKGYDQTAMSRRSAHCHHQPYRQRHKIENFFCRIKDWRRISTRYDKLARNFLAATTLVGVLYWIKL